MSNASGDRRPDTPTRPDGDDARRRRARLAARRAEDEVCWLCGGEVLKRHCKIICRRCGFTRDCSDP